MRLVLDTNVVVSGLLWDGLPRRLLQAAREARVELFTSTPLLSELTDILGRRKFARKIAASLLTVDEIVDRYSQLAALVRPEHTARIAPDPDDDAVVGTAIAAKAEFVVTGDRSLLSVRGHEGIRIVAVSEAVEAVDRLPNRALPKA